MEYFTFGMSKLRITQNYNGTTSHKPHWYRAEKFCDYPIMAIYYLVHMVIQIQLLMNMTILIVLK